jgi:hypothetical protein
LEIIEIGKRTGHTYDSVGERLRGRTSHNDLVIIRRYVRWHPNVVIDPINTTSIVYHSWIEDARASRNVELHRHRASLASIGCEVEVHWQSAADAMLNWEQEARRRSFDCWRLCWS